MPCAFTCWLAMAVAGLLLFLPAVGRVGQRHRPLCPLCARPRRHAGHLRGSLPEHRILGHNPLGALMVLALLGLLGFQVGSGLFATDVDSFLWDGPLAKLINSDLSRGHHWLAQNFVQTAAGRRWPAPERHCVLSPDQAPQSGGRHAQRLANLRQPTAPSCALPHGTGNWPCCARWWRRRGGGVVNGFGG